MDRTQWIPPHDPRRADGSFVVEDEHGRRIATADCGQRCPGCGLCCASYRDSIAADYAGTEEFEGNLKLGRGGLIKLEDNLWYRVPHCGPSCPGYERCCRPFELRRRPETVADARRILLEDGASQRWEMQESLLILAHEGTAEAVDVLEAFMPLAHTRLAGFAECALDEGRYFATIPRNAEEARTMMKREVLASWEDRAVEAYGKIEELEFDCERCRYETEIAQRLLGKAPDDSARETWRIQAKVLQMVADRIESDLAEQQEELALCETMIAEIEADLAAEQPEPDHDRDPHVGYDPAQNQCFACGEDLRGEESSERDIYGQTIGASVSLLFSDAGTNEAVWVYPGPQQDPSSASDPADGLRLVVSLDSRSDDITDSHLVYGVLREATTGGEEFQVFLPVVLREE